MAAADNDAVVADAALLDVHRSIAGNELPGNRESRRSGKHIVRTENDYERLRFVGNLDLQLVPAFCDRCRTVPAASSLPHEEMLAFPSVKSIVMPPAAAKVPPIRTPGKLSPSVTTFASGLRTKADEIKQARLQSAAQALRGAAASSRQRRIFAVPGSFGIFAAPPAPGVAGRARACSASRRC
jgi:hypothetical protein